MHEPFPGLNKQEMPTVHSITYDCVPLIIKAYMTLSISPGLQRIRILTDSVILVIEAVDERAKHYTIIRTRRVK